MDQTKTRDNRMTRTTSVKTDNYSVFLTPPMMAGLQSLAHLMMLDRILDTPVSLGFSRPRITLCFITLTNSLLLSFPSPSLSNRVNTFRFDLYHQGDLHPLAFSILPRPRGDRRAPRAPRFWPRVSWLTSRSEPRQWCRTGERYQSH